MAGQAGRDVRNEGAYDAATGATIRFEGVLDFFDMTDGIGAPPFWAVRAGHGDLRDALDVDLNGLDERAALLRVKNVVATGRIEVRNIIERGPVRVLVLDSLRPA